MKAALSGLSGFIGSHLAQELSSKGYSIIRVTQELLYSPKALNELFMKEKPELIFHLAAYGNMSNQKDIAMTVFANIIGSFNMLKESLEVPYKAFINFGSSSEYGKKFQAMKEEDSLNPETMYGASKASATHLAYAFAHQYHKPIITIRPFSVYGPGEAEFRFIPTIIRSMLGKETFMLDAKANHDWIYIDDLIEATLLVADKAEHLSNKVINIGSGRMHTNKEICEELKRVTGIQYLATKMEGMRKNDSEVWMSDNSRINSLGWYPKTMLEQGLKQTFDYYKELSKEEQTKGKESEH